jgi:hypothetical protein
MIKIRSLEELPARFIRSVYRRKDGSTLVSLCEIKFLMKTFCFRKCFQNGKPFNVTKNIYILTEDYLDCCFIYCFDKNAEFVN